MPSKIFKAISNLIYVKYMWHISTYNFINIEPKIFINPILTFQLPTCPISPPQKTHKSCK